MLWTGGSDEEHFQPLRSICKRHYDTELMAPKHPTTAGQSFTGKLCLAEMLWWIDRALQCSKSGLGFGALFCCEWEMWSLLLIPLHRAVMPGKSHQGQPQKQNSHFRRSGEQRTLANSFSGNS